MPFELLTPDEQKQFPEPCRSREHNPPPHMVIRRPMKWVCPACGASFIIRPAVCSDDVRANRKHLNHATARA